MEIAGITVTTGIISMLTLMMKGVYSVLASYLLIVTTPIEKNLPCIAAFACPSCYCNTDIVDLSLCKASFE